MIADRLRSLMHRLTDRTVLADLLTPAERALGKVRAASDVGRKLNMSAFVTLGVLRHLQGMTTLREQVQALLHLDPAATAQPPLARSTWSDALAAPSRLSVLRAVVPLLVTEARAVLPDRLGAIPGLGQRPVLAVDGTYQTESAHFRPCPPQAGGTDNPKGHGLLSFYDLRLGVPCDVQVETRSRHEVAVLRDYDALPEAVTRRRNALFIVDRAFIDASFWDRKKRALGITMMTRRKSNLRIDSTEDLPVADDPVNAGVRSDLRVTLTSSRELWRIVTYQTPRGEVIDFLTNDFSLLPGVVAFLYSRRWDEEKCFDTWKNDFAQAKAWGKAPVAIANQTLLAIVTALLIALLLHSRLGVDEAADTKALARQDKRQRRDPQHPDATHRPNWAAPLFRFTAKVSRQVLRFFQYCFLKPAAPALYQAHLRPLLERYL